MLFPGILTNQRSRSLPWASSILSESLYLFFFNFFFMLKEVADFCTCLLYTALWAMAFLNLQNHYYSKHKRTESYSGGLVVSDV